MGRPAKHPGIRIKDVLDSGEGNMATGQLKTGGLIRKMKIDPKNTKKRTERV